MSSAASKRFGFWISFLPPFAWMTAFYLVPLGALLTYAFVRHEFVHIIREFTWENFQQIFASPGYRNTLWRTFWIANLVTLIDTLLALPVAYFLAFRAGRLKQALMILVRVFAWRIILCYNGILNGLLVRTGILDEPSTLFLYNKFSVVLTLCYIWLPFMILPLTTAFERLPTRLLEASSDLGATPSEPSAA